MRKILLALIVIAFALSATAHAKHWEKVSATSNTAVGSTPVQLSGSTDQCQSFAIWEDTKTMTITVYLGNTYTADVFYTAILPGEILEINYHDQNLETTGIYVSTTNTGKVNYISRTSRGF